MIPVTPPPGEGLNVSGFSALIRHSDRIAGEPNFCLAVAEWGTICNAQLFAHDIDAAYHLADGVLDLKTRVHLDEEEIAVLIQKFESADAR